MSFLFRKNKEEIQDQDLKELYSRILSYCRYHLRDDDAARDCTQDVFSLYFEKNAQNEIHNPKAWLYRTADNFLYRYSRNIQEEKRRNTPLPDDDMSEDQRFVYEQDFDIFLERRESKNVEEEIEQVLSHLNQEEITLWDQHFKKHLPSKELAALYHVSIPAMKAKIHRLKLRILRVVNECYRDKCKKS